jgi:GAF domain-containing protein
VVRSDVTQRGQTELELKRLLGEQAAMRRVALLVARDSSQAEVFTAIAEEVGGLLPAEEIRMLRYEDKATALVVGSFGDIVEVMPVGTRQALGGKNAVSQVFETQRPARLDDYTAASGLIADTARSARIRGAVATPIVVEGRLWGTIVAGTTGDDPLPADTEARLGEFTELWPRRSPTPSRRRGKRSLPRSRRGCGAWPRSWRAGPRPHECSPPWPRRSGRSSGPTFRRSSDSRTTEP